MIPLAIALDATTMTGLPPSITADTGMDALTHSIEAYISKINNPNMMELASTAVKTIVENRKKDGHYKSIFDLAKRVPTVQMLSQDSKWPYPHTTQARHLIIWDWVLCMPFLIN